MSLARTLYREHVPLAMRNWIRRLLNPTISLVDYIRGGKARGFARGALFDPTFYKEAYPDVAHVEDVLHHYVYYGKQEGRLGVPTTAELLADRIDPNHECVVVIVHEASRTGAPILGWNVARFLSKTYNVVVLLISGGALESAFQECSVAVIKPPSERRFHSAEARHLVNKIVAAYRPIYVIANSVATQAFVPEFARAGIPVIALVHEFSGNTRPIGILNHVFHWAAHTVFSSELVARSSKKDYPILEVRDVSIMPQGSSVIPPDGPGTEQKPAPALRSSGSVLVVGMGLVQFRKGVDLFIAVAAEVGRIAPAAQIRFAWVGDGYKPTDDVGYSVYLAEQIERSDLKEANIVFVDALSDLEPIYSQSDLFLLSSRLDAFPNVAIDAMLHGLPVVCFKNATGVAEFLASDLVTRDLVVPHIDIAAAARVIVKLAEDRATLTTLSSAVKAKARLTFDMERYVSHLDRLGRDHNAGWQQIKKDRKLIMESNAFDPALFLAPGVIASKEAALSDYLVWSHLRTKARSSAARSLRRPAPGFNPLIYERENPYFPAETREDPFAHFLRSGRPAGPWSHAVITPSDRTSLGKLKPKLRVALHGHFHYPELLPDLLRRLKLNRTPCDLFLTTTASEKVRVLESVARDYALGEVSVLLVPNRGRDVGPFLSELNGRLSTAYDFVGHVHGKRSPFDDDTQTGERWRNFLWGNLIGSAEPMMDIVLARFAVDEALGLVFPEDPNLLGWDGNLEIAKGLMRRMNIREPLPVHFEFPVGTMFWARPAALRLLHELALSWDDYPAEPVPYDGTILHAVERLLPFVARAGGYGYATTHVAGITR